MSSSAFGAEVSSFTDVSRAGQEASCTKFSEVPMVKAAADVFTSG